MFSVQCSVMVALLCVCVGQAALPWGPNLWPNGSFEEGTNGWIAVAGPQNRAVDALALTDGCAGHRALRVANPPGVGSLTISPVLPLQPGWYVLSFWRRFDLRGSAQPQQLVYVDRHTGAAAESRRDSIYFYDNSTPASGLWNLTFLTFRLREGDTGVRLRFVADDRAAAMSLDAIQVRRLEPPSGPGVVTSVETEAYGTDRIRDPQAYNGFAQRVVEGKQARGGRTGGGTRFTSPAGLYRVTYRFRQETPGRGTVLGLCVGGDNGSTIEDISTSDFSGDGYQSFTVYWLYPFGMGCFPGWDWRGTGTYRFASVSLERLMPLTARESWDMLAGGVDVAKVLPPAAPLPVGTRAWVAAGLYTSETGVLTALGEQGRSYAQSSLTMVNGGGMTLAPAMPDLGLLETVVLANVPARAIPPVAQLALRRYVEHGGTLIVLGGFYAYGHGSYQGSFLEELLPVSVTRPFDLQPVSSALSRATWWFPARLGGCAWVHDVTVKEQAEVLWRVDGKPGVVTWKIGKGKVIAVTATVLGSPKNPFWESPAWRVELAKLLGLGNRQ